MALKQLLTFNLGLQTKLAPHLILPNQASRCVNIDLSKGSIYPFDSLEYNGTVTGKYIHYNTDGTLIKNTNELDIRSYAIFGNRVYWTDGTFGADGLRRYDGTDAGVEATASDAPNGTIGFVASGTNGGLNGDYVYTYTYVDTDGIESAPSTFFNVTTIGNQNIAITISAETNAPIDIASRRIYRTGGNNPTFNLIAEIVNPTLAYSDITRDTDVSRIELATFDNGSPVSDLDNLIENNGTLWASVGDKVYFSSNGQPEYWGALDYVVLNDTCTGLAKFADFVLAFTATDTYLISGFSTDTISIRLLPYREGCVGHSTIANVGDFTLWASTNGICIFNGSSVDVLTKNMISWRSDATIGDGRFGSFGEARFDTNIGFNIDRAIGLDGHYYAVFQDGVLSIDVTNKQVASTIRKEDAFGLYYDSTEDKLAIVSGLASPYTVEYFDSDGDIGMEAIWTTGEIQDEQGYGVKKQYRKVELDNIPISVKCFTENGKSFTSNKRKSFHLPSGFIGRFIQFEITTDVEIRSLEYQFGVLK